MSIKPILFNTEMVRAILDGCKTVTRRVVKPQPRPDTFGVLFQESHKMSSKDAPCRPGDILYVRETWFEYPGRGYLYKADHPDWFTGTRVNNRTIKWRPSIHMPRDAARIFLRVTDACVERLQAIAPEEVSDEGLEIYDWSEWYGEDVLMQDWKEKWAALWDSTIKPADRERCGWAANPWVWVIEFERCEKPEEGET